MKLTVKTDRVPLLVVKFYSGTDNIVTESLTNVSCTLRSNEEKRNIIVEKF